VFGTVPGTDRNTKGAWVALLVLVGSAVASEPEGSRATGAHFEVRLDFRDPALAREALEAAEAAW
jgi:hypothetical protein